MRLEIDLQWLATILAILGSSSLSPPQAAMRNRLRASAAKLAPGSAAGAGGAGAAGGTSGAAGGAAGGASAGAGAATGSGAGAGSGAGRAGSVLPLEQAASRSDATNRAPRRMTFIMTEDIGVFPSFTRATPSSGLGDGTRIHLIEHLGVLGL